MKDNTPRFATENMEVCSVLYRLKDMGIDVGNSFYNLPFIAKPTIKSYWPIVTRLLVIFFSAFCGY